ncbi:unnamed protein product [Cylicostephanus goldi]|uniref:Uncharacterized protein n=1 Tax=Cylicostephanus goldi TaxID=71465 RepID=A0A3P6SU81_CYLGO|nr:unnamed protein product [Cylicostephanus goldi]
MARLVELERRVKAELEWKSFIVEESPSKFTEAQIRQKLKYCGDKCNEFEERLEQAKLDVIALKGKRWETSYTVKESLQYMLEFQELRARHTEEKGELISWADQLLLAHEWYEILVAGDEAQEIDRLMFLSDLEETVIQVPTRPTEPGYPQPKQVKRFYKKETIGPILHNIRLGYDVLLNEESEEVHDVKGELLRGTAKEAQLVKEMTEGIKLLRDELQRQRGDRQWSGHGASDWQMQEIRDSIAGLKDEMRRQRQDYEWRNSGQNEGSLNEIREMIAQLTQNIRGQHEETRNWIQTLYLEIQDRLTQNREMCLQAMKEETQAEHRDVHQKLGCLEQQILGLGAQMKEEAERMSRESARLLRQQRR